MSNSKRRWITADPNATTIRPTRSLVVAAALMLVACSTAACSVSSAGDDDNGNETGNGATKNPSKPGETPGDSTAKAATTIDVEGAEGHVDRAYTFDLRSKDTTSDKKRTYRVASGDLPAGVTLAADGTLSGTPTASGTNKATIHGDGSCGDASCRLEVRFSVKVPDVVLLSGFGPFEDVPVNPSWQAVEPLTDTMIAGYDVRVIQVPVVWDEAVTKYMTAFDRLHPVMALASGVAMGETKGIRIETTARNHATGADVSNVEWPTGKIEATGAATYDAGLPVDLLKGALEQAKFPVILSDNAGAYLCNFLFYKIMRKVETEKDKTPHLLAGFVHVPGPDVVAPTDMTNAWKVMIERLGTHQREQIANNGSNATPPSNQQVLEIVHTPPQYRR